MPLPIIADTFRCAMEWSDLGTLNAVNVIHVKAPGKTATQVGTEIDAKVTAAMWHTVAGSVAVDRLVVTPLDGSSAQFVLNTGRPAKWQGAAGSQSIPAVSSIIKLGTALRGRSKRGRIFLPFVPESLCLTGRLPSADVATSTAAWVAFANALVADAYALVVASYKLAASEQVINLACEPVLATQRRRQQRLR